MATIPNRTKAQREIHPFLSSRNLQQPGKRLQKPMIQGNMVNSKILRMQGLHANIMVQAIDDIYITTEMIGIDQQS